MKVVVNRSRGKDCGYKLSKEACDILNVAESTCYYSYEERTRPDLVAVVERLQERANGINADLRVIEIPDDLQYVDTYGHTVRNWHLSERDGFELIRENHRTW